MAKRSEGITALTLSPSANLEVEEVAIDLYEKYPVVYLRMNAIGPRGVSEQSSLVSLYVWGIFNVNINFNVVLLAR